MITVWKCLRRNVSGFNAVFSLRGVLVMNLAYQRVTTTRHTPCDRYTACIIL